MVSRTSLASYPTTNRSNILSSSTQGILSCFMDSPNSDAFIFKRIKSGKPGRMAAFGSAFSDDQINQIVVFIRSLKPDEEPQNP